MKKRQAGRRSHSTNIVARERKWHRQQEAECIGSRWQGSKGAVCREMRSQAKAGGARGWNICMLRVAGCSCWEKEGRVGNW